MALTQLKTGAIADDAVTTDKLANAINTERTANTAKVSLDADSVTGAKIADDAVGAEHIETLDGNVQFADSAELRLGASSDLQLYHDATNSHIKNDTNALIIRSDALRCNNNGNTETMIKADADGAVELYHDNSNVCETMANGIKLTDTELTEASDNFSINIQSGNNDFYVKSGGTTFAAFKGSAKDLQLTSGNLVIGTSGKGIDFSATADTSETGSTMSNELLADYEVGAFTPKILKYVSGNWVDATMTSSTPTSCYYVKIGDIVHFHIGWDFQVSDSNYCALGGLPFQRSGRGTVLVHYSNAFANTQNQGGHLSGSGTAIQFYHSGNNWNSWNNNSSVYLYCDGVFRAS